MRAWLIRADEGRTYSRAATTATAAAAAAGGDDVDALLSTT